MRPIRPGPPSRGPFLGPSFNTDNPFPPIDSGIRGWPITNLIESRVSMGRRNLTSVWTVVGPQPVTVSPPVSALTLAILAPAVQQPVTVSPPVGALTLAAPAPTVQQPVSVSPPVGALSLTGLAPSIQQPVSVAVDVSALTLAAFAPSLSIAGPVTVTVNVMGLSLSALAPGITNGVTPSEVPAGRRTRTIYRITIDGQVFEFRSYAAAIQFLTEAQEVAEERITQDIDTAPPPPKITVNSRDLRKAANTTRKAIKSVYERELVHAELRMLLELARRHEEDDTLLLLM